VRSPSHSVFVKRIIMASMGSRRKIKQERKGVRRDVMLLGRTGGELMRIGIRKGEERSFSSKPRTINNVVCVVGGEGG